MAIILNPITLPASKFLSSMTTLIDQVRFVDTLSPTDNVNALVSSFRNNKVDYGKGIINTFKVDVQPVRDTTETSTLLEINKPNMAQEAIVIDQYKNIPISMSEVFTRDAVLSGSMVSSFYSFALSLLVDTQTFYFYDVCLALLLNWTPGQATQTVEVEQKDTTGLTGSDLEVALTWNANQIANAMDITVNNMSIKNSKFTDVNTYTVDGEAKPVVSAISKSRLELILNNKYKNDITINSLAYLYHADKVGDMIPGGSPIILPTDAIDTANESTIGWLYQNGKFSIADFYNLSLSFTDASTMYTNTFLHFAYGAGVFTYMPAIKFVAKIV